MHGLDMRTMKTPRPADRVALHLTAESKHAAGFGVKYDVLPIYRALETSRLVWPLEVPRDGRPILFQLYIFGRRPAVIALGINGPIALHICGGLLGRRLLCRKQAHACHQKKERHQTMDYSLPTPLHFSPR
jgi:hypothetical protein